MTVLKYRKREGHAGFSSFAAVSLPQKTEAKRSPKWPDPANRKEFTQAGARPKNKFVCSFFYLTKNKYSQQTQIVK